MVATVELEQSRDELQTVKYRTNELEKTCRNLEAEKETLKSTAESMERALEQKETKIERSLRDMVSLKEDMDRQLFDKEEELQNMRYAENCHRDGSFYDTDTLKPHNLYVYQIHFILSPKIACTAVITCYKMSEMFT